MSLHIRISRALTRYYLYKHLYTYFFPKPHQKPHHRHLMRSLETQLYVEYLVLLARGMQMAVALP